MSDFPVPLPLAVISPLVSVLAILFAIVSFLMMLIILVQKPKGGGLSGAFGGAGGSESAFMGARVGDFLTIVTASAFVVFVLLAMGLTWTTTPEAVVDDVTIVETISTTPQPAASPSEGEAAGEGEGEAAPADSEPAADAGVEAAPQEAGSVAPQQSESLGESSGENPGENSGDAQGE